MTSDPHFRGEPELTALTRLELELAPGGQPISGYIHDAAGRHPFAGWIELTRAISAAHQPVPPTDPGER